MKAPGTKGARWSDEETTTLLSKFDDGATIEEIMADTKRTVLGTLGKLVLERRLISTPHGFVRCDPFVYVTQEWIERYRDANEVLERIHRQRRNKQRRP